MARKKQVRIIFTPVGAAKAIDRSESRGRQHFQSGAIPTEYLIDGDKPAVSAETLARIAPTLNGRKSP
jgi:hypothetical protein